MLNIPAEWGPGGTGDVADLRSNQIRSLGAAGQGCGACWETSSPEPSPKAPWTWWLWSHVFTGELDISAWTREGSRIPCQKIQQPRKLRECGGTGKWWVSEYPRTKGQGWGAAGVSVLLYQVYWILWNLQWLFHHPYSQLMSLILFSLRNRMQSQTIHKLILLHLLI